MVRHLRVGVILLALVAAFVPVPAGWVETVYSEGAYLTFQRFLTPLSNRAPFAVADAVLVAFAAIVTWWCIRTFKAARSRGGAWRALWQVGVNLLATVAFAYLAFLAAWGLNYRRDSLRARLDYQAARATPASVTALAHRVVDRLNELSPAVHAGPGPGWDDLPGLIGPAFSRVQQQLADVEPAAPGRPKWSVLTWYMERAGVSGFTSPFTLETMVDWSQLPLERPFVAAHEWAHLAGYADEADANFIGWLVCLQGPPAAEYSGHLVLVLYLMNAVPDGEREDLARALGEGPREDLRAMRRRAARVWPLLQRPAWWVYDRYLRANRVQAGVRSYGGALELMLATRFGNGWVPMRRDRER